MWINNGDCSVTKFSLSITGSTLSWTPPIGANILGPSIKFGTDFPVVVDVLDSFFDYAGGIVFDGYFPSDRQCKLYSNATTPIFRIHEGVASTARTTLVDCSMIVRGSSAAAFCGAAANTLTFDKSLFVGLIATFGILVLFTLTFCGCALRRSQQKSSHYTNIQ
jgi:hypothetical protein